MRLRWLNHYRENPRCETRRTAGGEGSAKIKRREGRSSKETKGPPNVVTPEGHDGALNSRNFISDWQSIPNFC